MNDLSFQKSPDKSQISYFLLCNYIGFFIPVARLESDRLLKHAQSLQLAVTKAILFYLDRHPCKQTNGGKEAWRTLFQLPRFRLLVSENSYGLTDITIFLAIVIFFLPKLWCSSRFESRAFIAKRIGDKSDWLK